MDNYYELLKCSMDAAPEELKSAYQTLAREHHPDKLMQQGASDSEAQMNSGQFTQIDKAWKVLGDPELRKEYDAKWQQRCLAQKWPIQDDVEFVEFYLEEDDCFYYDCRCGGQHILTSTDVSFKVDLVCCGSCSLSIRVLYSDDDQFTFSSSNR